MVSERKRHIAITGGIGSGKSFVCSLLSERGIKVYDCDDAAKRLMMTSDSLRSDLQYLVGNDVFLGGKLNKPLLTSFLMASDSNLTALNNVVHPAVATDFLQSGYEWLESAILFDSGFDKRLPFDAIVCVAAPLDVRIERIMSRDGINRRQALDWIERQMPQDEVVGKSDYVIVNDGKTRLRDQIDSVLSEINNK